MLTPNDYRILYESCTLTADVKARTELDLVCKVAIGNVATYQSVERLVSIPWPLIAALHFRESGQSFQSHLHNGDPLAARTIHVPQGRPQIGTPPFTWIESAMDALGDVWVPTKWDVPGCLEFLERYNGLGYQHRGVFTPYLWNYTDKYVAGLYVADGAFDPEKVERRPGCVAILKTLGVTLDFPKLAASDSSLH